MRAPDSNLPSTTTPSPGTSAEGTEDRRSRPQVHPGGGALVTDGGSLLSHAAIVAREHGIPAVVGTGNATRRLRDGQIVTVDGNRGVVTTTAPT